MNTQIRQENRILRTFFSILLGILFFTILPPGNVCLGQSFQDRTQQYYSAGLGSKAAWGDFNNDGWVDLCNGSQILLNNGGQSFSLHSTVGGMGLWGDFNNDGYLDLYTYKNQKLLQNNGSAGGYQFQDVTASLIPSFGTHFSRGAAWADINNDGRLDLYVGGYEDGDMDRYSDKLLTYQKTTQQFSVELKPSTWPLDFMPGRGVTAADFDRDGDQDMYVSNYRLKNNFLWINNGNASLSNQAEVYGVAGDRDWYDNDSGHTIGSAWGDFDNDGYLDLFVGNFAHPVDDQDRSMFYKNQGPGGNYRFECKKTLDSSSEYQESYASPALADYDNDGDLDLFLTTVYNPGSYGIANYCRLYRNDGNWQFTDVTDSAGLDGLDKTYQAAWADVDNDGDMDLVSDGKLFINDASTNGNHWLKVHVKGDGETVNSAGIGTQVLLHIGNQTLVRQVEGGTGEGNQNELTLHFGLGSYASPVDLEIFWPDGTSEMYYDVNVNQTITVPEPGTCALLSLAAIHLFGYGRRRRTMTRR